jgi:Uma2 family endonuclease
MEAVLEHLLYSPRLAIYSRYIQSVLSDERERREQFYEEIKENQKAEFINGEIIVHSPVKLEHTIAGKLLLKLLDTYVQIYDLGFAGYEKMLICLSRNDYEPDVCFWKNEKSSGFARGQTKFPAPDFIAEVLSPGTEKTDRTIKRDDYAAHGVAEYWIIDPETEIAEQYVLDQGEYRLRVKADSGVLKCQVISGFDIPVRALFDKDENLAALRKILDG